MKHLAIHQTQQQSHLLCPATELGQKLSRLLLCKILLSNEVLSRQSRIKLFRNREKNAIKAFQEVHREFYAAYCMLLAAASQKISTSDQLRNNSLYLLFC